jgi:hypothetical protein
MTNPSDPQIGIQFPLVRLAKSDNIGLIEYGNQGSRQSRQNLRRRQAAASSAVPQSSAAEHE